jgi:dUTP pyrophosphatase
MNVLEIVKHDVDAVMPSRAHPSDIGYDLTAIGVWKVLSDKTVIFETGISVKPPLGMYVEIIPRSSITKTGYMLANSVGIIDPHYTGTCKIAVRKIDDSFPDLVPPFCKFQLVMRQAINFCTKEVGMIDETDRGSGGFGSSDK